MLLAGWLMGSDGVELVVGSWSGLESLTLFVF